MHKTTVPMSVPEIPDCGTRVRYSRPTAPGVWRTGTVASPRPDDIIIVDDEYGQDTRIDDADYVVLGYQPAPVAKVPRDLYAGTIVAVTLHHEGTHETVPAIVLRTYRSTSPDRPGEINVALRTSSDLVWHVPAGSVTRFVQSVSPMPGDVVRLSAPWRQGSLDVGEVAVIEGVPGHSPESGTARITFDDCVLWTEQSVSCTAGSVSPTIRLTELHQTSDTDQVRAWRPRADQRANPCGTRFLVTVPVWDWAPLS